MNLATIAREKILNFISQFMVLIIFAHNKSENCRSQELIFKKKNSSQFYIFINFC